MGQRANSAYHGYLIAIVATVSVGWVRYALSDFLGNLAPFILFVPSVVVAAWYGGLKPGLLATVLSALMLVYVFIPPAFSLRIERVGDAVNLAIFVIASLAVCALSEKLHAARRALQAKQSKLRETREFQDAISALTSDFAYRAHLGQDGQIVIDAVSDGFSKVFGYTLDELVTRGGWLTLIHPDDMTRAKEALQRLFIGQTVEAEFRCLNKAGRVICVRARTHPVRNELGQVVRVFGAAHDVTPYQQAEAAIRASEERMRLAMDAAQMGSWERNVATNEVIWSPETRKLLDVSLDTPATLDLFLSLLHVDDRARIRRAMEEAHHTGHYEVDYRIMRPDGSIRWLASRGRILPNEQGQNLRMVGVVNDITIRKEGEELLRQSEERFRSLTNATTAIIWTTDASGGFVAPQPSWAEYTGQTWDEYRGVGWTNALHPDDRHRIKALWEGACSAGTLFQVEGRLWHASSGSYRHFEARGVPIRNPDGLVREWVGKYMDVENYRQAEERLRQSERLYRAIGESMDYGVWVCDAEGRNLYASDSFLRLVGMTQKECDEFGWARLLHPEDAERTLVAWKECVRIRGTWDIEHRFRGVDGGYHPVLARGVPVLDEEGRILYWAGINLDISRLKQTEDALRHVTEQLQIVTDAMSVPVTRCTRDLRYKWVSKPCADWLGRSPDEIVGHSIAEVIGPDAFTLLRPYFDRVLSGETVRYEEEVNYQGLGRRWVQAIYTPTLDSDGIPDGWVAVVIDIDDRKRTEETLKEADRRKDEFLATLAHELRNPLAPIRNALEILRLSGDDESSREQARSMMERQMQQMVRLIDDLLDVSRITRGRLELRKERVELETIITNAIETARPLIDVSGHELTVTLPPTPIYIDGDLTRLAQVFSNLLNNAAKYTENGGHIWLAAQREGSDAVVSVRDNGLGIPQDMLPHIFEMFTQVDRSLERSQGGLGIGLTIVSRLVEMHGGSIEVHSDGYGGGSEFIVRLPVMISSPKNGQHGKSDNEKPAVVVSKHRLLVVDDNQDAASSLSALLEMTGHEVRTAYDGLAALEVASEYRPDVILLDIGLPKLNGYEVARRIRAQPWGESIMLIALTGWGQDEDKRRSMEAGFNHHLVKPVDPSALDRLLASLPAMRVEV